MSDGRGRSRESAGVSSSPPFTWIDTEDGLSRAVDRLAKAKAIGVDTEADSFYHYFHKCCLIQVSDGKTTYLVDPLALKKLGPLGDLFAASDIVKILHAAEQDVLYLRRDYGFEVSPLFDTMIAAQLLGSPGIGLASLLSTHFDVTMDKGCQRDDWSRRPLTDRQKRYAGEDVRYLIRLRSKLESALKTKERIDWAREEFGLVAARNWERKGFDRNGFWGVKGARDLSPREAAVLRELYVMRDGRAREADLPPFRIVSDQTLLALARRSPRAVSDMEGIKGLTPLVRRRIGSPVLTSVQRGLDLDESKLPTPPRSPRGRRRTSASASRLERLKAWRRRRAADLEMDPGVLFPQSLLEALSLAGPKWEEDGVNIAGLREWRRRLLLPDARELLA